MKFLRKPGRVKTNLWRVSLHEASHAVAFSYFLHVQSTARIFHRGGQCSPLRCSAAGPAARAILYLAGDAGASLAQFSDCNQVPAGRPRFGRKRFFRRLHRLRSDKTNVDGIIEQCEPLREDPKIEEMCREQWEQTALNFVCCRRKLIVEIATKLYLAGRVYVPARNADDADWAMEFALGK